MGSTTPTRDARDSETQIRVLFVGTDETSIEAARSVFEDEFGFDVIVASRIEDAVRSLDSVDCVVTDVSSSTSTGLELLRDVRRSAPDLPSISVSEARDDDVIGETLSAGATDYLRIDRTDAGYRSLASRVLSVTGRRRADTAAPSEPPLGDVTSGSSLLDDSLTFVAVSASYAELHGYGPTELVGEPWETVFPDEESKRLEDIVRRVRDRGSVTEEPIALRTDGSTFPARVTVSRVATDRYVSTVFDRADRADSASGRTESDTSALERRVSDLETIFATISESETPRIRDVCDAVVETVGDGSESAVGVYLYDESTDALRRRAASPGLEEPAPTLPFDERSTPVWHAFVERESVLVTELFPRPDGPVRKPDRARGIVVPIGTHGVLLAGTIAGDRPTRLDHAFARLVGATAGALLESIESERRLEALATTNERLAGTTRLVRSVGGAIGTARTRGELEHRLCERIVANDRYAFARIAEPDAASKTLHHRAWAGSEKGYLEGLETEIDALVDEQEPAACAIRTTESRAIRHLTAGSADHRWRRDAIARGYRSVVAVPLVFWERSYGSLTVYSGRPDAFDESEREVFEELGRSIGHAIHAIEMKTALVGRGGVELEFRVRDRGIQFLEWARETGCTFEFETAVSRPDGAISGFFTITDAPVEAILELASRSPAVTETRLVTERGSDHLFECTLTEDSVVAQLLEYGVVPKTISATEAAGRLVVVLPERTAVRAFVDVFTRMYPDSTLVRRRDQEFRARTEYGFLADLERELTARQFEVLETAFVSGYFEVPRAATGAEVAAGLGISQPTFNHHLRVAQRKLIAMLLTDRKSHET